MAGYVVPRQAGRPDTRGEMRLWSPTTPIVTTMQYGVQMKNHSSTFVMATYKSINWARTKFLHIFFDVKNLGKESVADT